MPQVAIDIAINRLAPALGAEVVGLDLARPFDAPTLARVREAFQEHHMLCFRDQRLSDDELIGVLAAVRPPGGLPREGQDQGEDRGL